VELKITLEGDKRVSTQVGKHRIMTDQSVKAGGEDSAPAPFDLFVASLGTCAGFFVQSYCQNKGIDPSGIEITIGSKRDPEKKAITGFVTTLHLPEEIPERLHSALKRVVDQCTVKKVIANQPEFEVVTVVRKD